MMTNKILNQDAERYGIQGGTGFSKVLTQISNRKEPTKQNFYIDFYITFMHTKIILRFRAILKSERDYISGIRFV